MARKAIHITILQTGPGHISFVRGGEAGGVLAQVSERGAWSADDGSLAAALKDFVKRHELAQDRVFFVLPRHEAAVRILELPTQDPVELGGMVHLGAEEIVPFPLDELATSYCLLENLDGGSARVLAVVVRRTIIEGHVAMLRDAGVAPEQVFLSTACLLTALKGTDTVAVHVAPGGLEVAVLREGCMTFGRGVAVDVAAADEVAAEVRGSLSASRRESPDGTAPNDIVVSSEGIEPDGIVSTLASTLGLSARAYGEQGLGSAVAAGALASARGDRAFPVELLPETEVRRRAAVATRSRGMRVAIAALIALVATAAMYGQAVMQRRSYLAELDQRADAMRPNVQTLRTKRQQLNLIQEQVHRSVSPIAIMATLAELAPDSGLNITRFSYDKDQGVTINGSAMEPKKFDQLIDGIRGPGAAAIPQLAAAMELYRTERRERGKSVWDFAVTVPFNGAAADE